MNDKITVIGAGMMGGAIIKSLLKGGYQGKITAVDIQLEKLKEFEALGVKTSTDNKKAAGDADIVFIIVKPGDVEKVLKEISKEIKGKLLISVAATVPLKFLKKNAPDAKIVRIMPNLGALVQAAYTAYCCEPNVTATGQRESQNPAEHDGHLRRNGREIHGCNNRGQRQRTRLHVNHH